MNFSVAQEEQLYEITYKRSGFKDSKSKVCMNNRR